MKIRPVHYKRYSKQFFLNLNDIFFLELKPERMTENSFTTVIFQVCKLVSLVAVKTD